MPVIQDRVTVNAEGRSRLTEAVEIALRFGKGKVAVYEPDDSGRISLSPPAGIARIATSTSRRRRRGLFSFNHPHGACPTCRGFGRTIAIDLMRAIPDRIAEHRRKAW